MAGEGRHTIKSAETTARRRDGANAMAINCRSGPVMVFAASHGTVPKRPSGERPRSSHQSLPETWGLGPDLRRGDERGREARMMLGIWNARVAPRRESRVAARRSLPYVSLSTPPVPSFPNGWVTESKNSLLELFLRGRKFLRACRARARRK